MFHELRSYGPYVTRTHSTLTQVVDAVTYVLLQFVRLNTTNGTTRWIPVVIRV